MTISQRTPTSPLRVAVTPFAAVAVTALALLVVAVGPAAPTAAAAAPAAERAATPELEVMIVGKPRSSVLRRMVGRYQRSLRVQRVRTPARALQRLRRASAAHTSVRQPVRRAVVLGVGRRPARALRRSKLLEAVLSRGDWLVLAHANARKRSAALRHHVNAATPGHTVVSAARIGTFARGRTHVDVVNILPAGGAATVRGSADSVRRKYAERLYGALTRRGARRARAAQATPVPDSLLTARWRITTVSSYPVPWPGRARDGAPKDRHDLYQWPVVATTQTFTAYLSNDKKVTPPGTAAQSQYIHYKLDGTVSPVAEPGRPGQFIRDPAKAGWEHYRGWWTAGVEASVRAPNFLALRKAAPTTPNTTRQYTSGIQFSVGFSASAGKTTGANPGAQFGGAANASFAYNDSTTREIPDWGVRSRVSGNTGAWSFYSKSPCDYSGGTRSIVANEGPDRCFATSRDSGWIGNHQRPLPVNELSSATMDFHADALWETTNGVETRVAQFRPEVDAIMAFTWWNHHRDDWYDHLPPVPWFARSCPLRCKIVETTVFDGLWDPQTNREWVDIDLGAVVPVPISSITLHDREGGPELDAERPLWVGSANRRTVTACANLAKPAPAALRLPVGTTDGHNVSVNGVTQMAVGERRGCFRVVLNTNDLSDCQARTAEIGAFYAKPHLVPITVRRGNPAECRPRATVQWDGPSTTSRTGAEDAVNRFRYGSSDPTRREDGFVCQFNDNPERPCAAATPGGTVGTVETGIGRQDRPAQPRLGNPRQGENVLRVWAVDIDGNRSEQPATATFRYDAQPPTINRVAPARAVVRTNQTTDLELSFGSNKPVSSFVCAVDSSAAFEPCDGAGQPAAGTLKIPGPLAEGPHEVRVVGSDLATPPNRTPVDPPLWRVVIDTVPPTATIVDGPPEGATVGRSSTRFVVRAPDEPEGVVRFECRLDSSAPTDWEECGETSGDGTLVKEYSGLTDGPHRFEARATDEAGNLGPAADRSWTVDTTLPVVTFDAAPNDPTNSTTASFAFSSDRPGSTFECRSGAAGPWTDCASPTELVGLADGTHTFEVRATDTIGNVSAPERHRWTVDTVAPNATIDTGPASPSPSRAVELRFSADKPSTFECRLDGGPWTPCSSPHTLDGLADGHHAFEARPTDGAGNVGAAARHEWTTDATPPRARVTAGPAGVVDRPEATFSFAADKPGARFECRIDLPFWPFTACTSPYSPGHLGLGDFVFEVRAIDTLGTVGPVARRAWSVRAPQPDRGDRGLVPTVPADPPRAALRLRIVSAPRQVRPGRRMRVAVAVRNVGSAPAGSVRICLRAPGRTVARRCARLGVIAAGRSARGAIRAAVLRRPARGRAVHLAVVATGEGADGARLARTVRVR